MKFSQTLVFGMLLAGGAQAGSWSDLWYRRDQQGQHALEAGDSTRAAELFADPRLRAYAELQSQQYAAAAKRLEPFADGDSQYNRGNALARSGDLQGALNAYDGVLKHADLESSLRRDAQHNRDLVARQLQAQQDRERSSSDRQANGKENGKPESNETKEGSGNAGSSAPPPAAASASPSQGGKNKPEGGEASGSTPPSRSSPPSSPAQGAGGDEPRDANGTPQSTPDRNASSPQTSQQQVAGQRENAGRQEPSPRSGSQSGTGQEDGRQAAIGDSSRPQTEQQLALEQWLRQIPDDPGGLLRRKFMIEHWMKQQQVQP
jgi:Ca-activated chloride channel family protein